MTEGQFIDAVLEHLFVRGLNCPNLSLLAMYVRMDWERLRVSPDSVSFAEKCVQLPGVTYQPTRLGKNPSLSAGASEQWLAVHEGGHAIVGLMSGFTLRGVRFYGDDGFPGETGLEDVPWKLSADEALLRRLVRVDVAGNVAQMLYPGCEAPMGGRLSMLYNDRTPGDRPTDFISADARAARLTFVLQQWDGKPPVPTENWEARRAILVQAEAEAEGILKANFEKLSSLADQLQRGPMTGAAVRTVMDG
jgi:hypothetical protein